ncbi:MAG TPA: fibronectin type III domain-containing protein, partial [Chryseolinea sp.]
MKNKLFGRTIVASLIVVFLFFAGFVYEHKKISNGDHHDHTDQYHEHSHAATIQLPPKLLFPSTEPDRVILNLTESPETSIAVNWRTDTTIQAGYVEWAKATAGPEFLAQVTKVEAQREALKVKHREEPEV